MSKSKKALKKKLAKKAQTKKTVSQPVNQIANLKQSLLLLKANLMTNLKLLWEKLILLHK